MPADDAIEEVHQRLHQQLPADTTARLVKGLCRDGQPAEPEEADQPVTEIATLEQHENDEHQDEARRSQGTDYRREPRKAREPRDLFGGDDNGPRDGSFGRLRSPKVGRDVVDGLLQLLDRSRLFPRRERPQSSPGC